MDKRISALAMAIQMGATIYDLEEAELCYAPQFGSAKDPVNFAGHGRRRRPARRHAARPLGRRRTARSCSTCASRWNWSSRACRARSTSRCRSSARASASCRATARSTSSAAPAQRAYYATRILLQNGFKARNLSGGMLSRVLDLLTPPPWLGGGAACAQAPYVLRR